MVQRHFGHNEFPNQVKSHLQLSRYSKALYTRGLAHFYQAIFLEIRFGITDEKFLWPSLEVTKNVSCDGLFFTNSNGSEGVVKITFTDGILSPFTLDEKRETLFHFRISYASYYDVKWELNLHRPPQGTHRPDVCSWLLQLGLDSESATCPTDRQVATPIQSRIRYVYQ